MHFLKVTQVNSRNGSVTKNLKNNQNKICTQLQILLHLSESFGSTLKGIVVLYIPFESTALALCKLLRLSDDYCYFSS